MFVGLLFWFQFYCGFSASAMIDQWYLIFFNLLFSSLPQLVTGVLDRDVPADVLLTEPQLYKSGQNMEVSPPPPPTPGGCMDDRTMETSLKTPGGGKKPILLADSRGSGEAAGCAHVHIL